MKPIDILLADDDTDDRLFFKDALDELPVTASFSTVSDGEQLMKHLEKLSPQTPDILFLDLNMPRKNGFECLTELKSNPLYQKIPVIIYSTSYDEEMAHQLLASGANYYICKPSDFNDLKKVINLAVLLIQSKNINPTIENFLITKLSTVY